MSANVQVGDIVSVSGHSGLWVMHRLRPDLPNRGGMLATFRQNGKYNIVHAITVGLPMASLVKRPVYEVGQIVSYGGQPAEITALNESGTLRIEFARREPLTPDQDTHVRHHWRLDVPRASIALDNVDKLIQH